MELDEDIKTNLIMRGGKVAGINCPNCEFESRDVELAAHAITDVTCPDCGTRVLTEDQKTRLRRADKL